MTNLAGNSTLSGCKLKDVLLGVAQSIGIDPVAVEQKVLAVKQASLKFIPVRHHSPSSARLVKRAITEWKPKLVLIEGPTDTDSLIPFIVDNGSVPPLAILSMFTDDTNYFKLNGEMPFSPDPSVPAKFQVHYPFISYSPEFVALQECTKKKIPVHFIDLPLSGIIPFMINSKEKVAHLLKHEEDAMSTSDYYKQLVDIFHFEDFNEVWDTLFEIGVQDLSIEDLQENMLFFCACVRTSMDPDTLELEGDLDRERYMRFMIDKYVKDYGLSEKDVIVITGGMHSVALPVTTPSCPAFPAKGTLNSLVPYSYFRISEVSGYGSGNQGPLYYERAWQNLNKETQKPYEEIALDFITEILRDARKKEQVISVSDSINAYQGAIMLGRLRKRHEPCMKDMIDAIYMCVVKGNPDIEGAYLPPVIRDRVVGHKVGRVTKRMGRLPLQADFYLRFESLGIEISEKTQAFNLNLRDETDMMRSVIFWRLSFMSLDILDRTSGPDILKGQTGIFSETWTFNWNPGVDVKLIELNIYGSTIEEASRSMLIEELQKQVNNFEAVTGLLYKSIVMGFTGDFNKIHQVCMDSLDHDDKFISLSAGFMNAVMLFQLLKILLNQESTLELVGKLLSRSYFATCFALPNYANPKDEMVVPLVIAIKKMSTTLMTFSGQEFDLSAFFGSLQTCITTTTDEFIKGCCVGITYLMNNIGLPQIKQYVLEYTKSEDTIKVKVGEFIRGIIFECQSQILFNPDVIALLDEVIRMVDWPVFAAILPSLKKGFSGLEPREYDIFVEKLAELYGLKAKVVKELDDEVQDQHAAIFGEINKKVHDIYHEWFGDE